MTDSRNANIIAVFIILEKENAVFLLRRHNTGYRDGELTLIAGHVERGESYIQAAIREAAEEAGITLSAEDLEMCHVQHRKSYEDDSERVDIYFRAKKWVGEPFNKEPHKASEAGWFHHDDLEKHGIIDFIHRVIIHSKEGRTYSEIGWDRS